jgi:hypothetical protein
MLVRGLEQFDRDNRPDVLRGNGTAERAQDDALRPRRHFSRLLAAMITADAQLAPPVLTAMAEHGIRTGASNAELREAAREQEAK